MNHTLVQYGIIAFSLLAVCCTGKSKLALVTETPEAEPAVEVSELEQKYGIKKTFGYALPRHADSQHIDSLLATLNAGDSYVFTDLYPITDTLPFADDDSFMLAEKFEQLGYTYVSGGRGNYENGPRFRYRGYENDSLRYDVYKAYQYHQLQPDSSYNLLVFEQIECSKPQ